MTEKRVDEEWKRKAREEAEKLSESKDAAGPDAGAERGRLPAEASFPFIVSSLVAQALIALGAIENPVTGQAELDLEAAKFSIDMLQVLADKTKGNLTPEEESMLTGSLYDLRMQYVEASS